MSPTLPKDVIASLAVYLKPVAQTLGLQFFVEGVDDVTDEIFQNDSMLLRMTGPTLYEGSNEYEWYRVEVQVLLTDIVQRRGENGYNIYNWSGEILEKLRAPVPVIKFHPTDPQLDELIGCLAPDRKVKNNLRVVNYNQVDKDVPVRQMSVNGMYILEI